MGFVIVNGTGDGEYSAKVTSENLLSVLAVTESIEHHVNQYHGQSYSMLFSATPTGAGDCFLYLKNESTNEIVIEGLSLKLAASEYFDVKLGVTGTPVGGSDVTPGNLNANSGFIADGTFQHGNDITGLSDGTTIYRFYHLNSVGSTYYNFEQDVILSKNNTFSLWIQTGTTALAGFIDFYYHQ